MKFNFYVSRALLLQIDLRRLKLYEHSSIGDAHVEEGYMSHVT